MKIAFAVILALVLNVQGVFAQVYNIATENGNTISTCGGIFTDSDAFNNEVYINNEEYMVTFCSGQPGSCLLLDFTQFNIPDAQDWLYIWDGADTTSGTYVGRYNNPFGSNTNNLMNIYPNGIQSTTGCFTFVFISDGDFVTGNGWSAILTCQTPCATCYDGIQNGMETDVDCGGVCTPCPEPINIADGGTNYACGNIFVDSGGEDDQYDDNENHIATICSDNPNPNYCLIVNFVQYELNWGDHLYIYDGPTTAYPLIGNYTNFTAPGSVLASGQCLTFKFTSDTWSTADGWLATIDCQECAAEPVPTIADCLGALPVCGNIETQSTAPSGSGNYADVFPANSCNVIDFNSVWYVFDVATSGILNFDLNSTPNTNNYNWTLLDITGLDCNTLSTATTVSCNSYFSGPTGISTANGGVGNTNSTIPYNADVNVVAGETYALVISKSSATSGFTLDFSASTASITDTYDPVIQSVQPSCANNEIVVTFSEQVACSSLSELDFAVIGASGTINVLSISSDWCDAGLDGSVTYSMLLDGVMNENQAYVLSLSGADGGIEDLCGNVNNLQSFAFNTGFAMSLDIDITPSDCADTQPTGELAIQVVGGVEPYYLEVGSQYGYDDSVFVFSNLPAGIQQVDVYDDSGCHAIFLIDIPTSNSNMDNEITIGNVSCVGGDGYIEISTQGAIGYGPWKYIISDTSGTVLAIGNNTDYVFLNNLDVGEYTISIEDLSGLSPCPDLQTVYVDVPDSILVTTVSDTTICYFGQTYLSASVEGGTGSPFTMYWSDGTNNFTTGPNQFITKDSLITNTVFSVYAQDNLGCVSEIEQVNVNVNDLITFDMDPDQIICAGTSTMVGVSNINGGEGYGYDVYWDIGDNLIIDQDSILVIPSEPSVYCVHVNDQCETPPVDSCITVSPTLYIPVSFSITSDTASCPPYLASFANTTNPTDVASAIWNFGDGSTATGINTVNHIFNESGNYDVTLSITDPDGCVFDTTIVDAISMYPEPVAQFSTNPEVASLINSTVQFNNESEGAIESYWLFDTINQLGEAHEDSPFFVFPDQVPDEYFNRLTVTNDFGCSDFITKMLVIEEDLTLYVPNSFSPNGDGKNDYFYIKAKELDPVFFHLVIFDRWGNVVFESNNINERWNGSVNGSDYYSQPGVFVYNLSYKISESTEKKEVNGMITLIK